MEPFNAQAEPAAPVAKRAYQSDMVPIRLDKADAAPLFRQLYLALRGAILSGQLVAGERLPATRSMAANMGVARNTVITAYEQLRVEGYLEGRVGSGTVVARDLPVDYPTAGEAHPRELRTGAVASLKRDRRLTHQALNAVGFIGRVARRGDGAFEIDTPALDALPLETLRRLLTPKLRTDFRRLLTTSDPAGIEPLRRAIAEWAQASRGIVCSANQVVVTAGGQHGIDLVARALLAAGDMACVEDPGDPFVRSLLLGVGARVIGIPVNEEGVEVERLPSPDAGARLVHLTPSNHYPLGGTLPMARRIALLNWAQLSRAIILEDDCDSEFRYSSRPLAALKALDAADNVIYVGTFSRIILPSLRLGYLILPEDLVAPVVSIRSLTDRHPPPIEQLLVAEFMLNGHFSTHVRRMRKLYADRQQTLVAALRREFSDVLEIQPAGAGMHIIGWLPDGWDDAELARLAAARGLVPRPLSPFYYQRKPRPGVMLGHAGITSGQLRTGLRLLAKTIAAAGRSAAMVARANGSGPAP
ncbi:MAG: PLP-dependent aminotransferase family protein [Proteobacteria bacterium]|nr:PLP-dependent aminotransferase family protein [Pseudomonadota bacterium]